MEPIYKPQPVEVLAYHGTMTPPQLITTVASMLQHAFRMLTSMFSHPDRVTTFSIDPEHKTAYGQFLVIMSETATPEEIDAARAELSAAFDKFIADERPKFCRIALPESGVRTGGVLLQ